MLPATPNGWVERLADGHGLCIMADKARLRSGVRRPNAEGRVAAGVNRATTTEEQEETQHPHQHGYQRTRGVKA